MPLKGGKRRKRGQRPPRGPDDKAAKALSGPPNPPTPAKPPALPLPIAEGPPRLPEAEPEPDIDLNSSEPPAKPPAKPPDLPPPIAEGPPRLPEAEPEPDIDLNQIEGHEDTICAVRKTPGSEPDLREPTVGIRPQSLQPVSLTADPSVVQSRLGEYESQLIEIESLPDGDRLRAAQELQETAGDFYQDILGDQSHTRQELQQVMDLRGKVEDLIGQLKQLRAKRRVEAAQRAAAERQPQEPVEEAILTPPSPSTVDLTLEPFEAELTSNTTPIELVQPDEKQSGMFKRFITSPLTWAVTTVSLFTGLLFQQNAFQDIAKFVGMALKKKPPSDKLTAIVYGAVVVTGLAVTIVINAIRNRNKGEGRSEERSDGGPTE